MSYHFVAMGGGPANNSHQVRLGLNLDKHSQKVLPVVLRVNLISCSLLDEGKIKHAVGEDGRVYILL